MDMEKDILDTLIGTDEDSWFEPTNKSPQASIQEGTYNAKIVDLNIKADKEVQGKFLADIYEPVFEIDGVEVKHKGLFRFKKPDPSVYPHLQADMGSNAGYYAFMSLASLQVEKDGKILLPQLTDEMVKDTEWEVQVVVEKWTGREGNEMQTPRVSKTLQFLSTEKVGDLPLTDDDLPF